MLPLSPEVDKQLRAGERSQAEREEKRKSYHKFVSAQEIKYFKIGKLLISTEMNVEKL